MSDLRSRCLTAMTEAMVDEGPDALLDDLAVAGMDALLGVLEENIGEWADEAIKDYTHTAGLTRYPRTVDMLTVLKPTTEEVR